MTEQEFTEKAREIGIRDENILSAIDNFHLIEKEMPEVTLDELFIDCTLKAQEKSDNETDSFITVD